MRYEVLFSGHGSEFVSDNAVYSSLQEARMVALEWQYRADTIGGLSKIINKKTKKEMFFGHYKSKKMKRKFIQFYQSRNQLNLNLSL